MIVLHIASINGSRTSGVNVVVPQHVKAQSAIAQAGLVNIRNIVVDEEIVQMKYNGAKSFPDYLDVPFNKPDIVVFHEINVPEYIKIYPNLIRKNIPYIVVPHGENTDKALKKKWLKKKLAYLLLFNRFIRHAAGMQCLSQGEYDETHTSDKKFIVPNGMDLHGMRLPRKKRDGIKLLYIGRLDLMHKGLDLLVEAIAKCGLNELSLDIYGPDYADRQKALMALVKKYDCQSKIFVHDAVFGEDKAKKYNECDLFIQTSRFEGLPLGMLEAMSYGVPVIATEGTNLTALIEKYNAGYTATTDVEGIVKALHNAVDTKTEWDKKGANARVAIEDAFTWQRIAQQTIDKYKLLVGENG